MNSIRAIGAYLPRLRLARSAMATSLGWLASSAGAGKGTRSLAFWDEDSLTMAVAASRRALHGQSIDAITSLTFATTTAPFAEPQNASLIRAALRLSDECLTQDTQGTPRATLLALHSALEAGSTTLIAAGELPCGAAGSVTEARAGDAGAAVLTGDGPGLFNYLGGVSLSAPFVERYRAIHRDPLDWEERWVREEGYLDLVPKAIERALTKAGISAGDVDHLVLPCPIAGVAAAVKLRTHMANAKVADSLAETCGDTGTAHALIMLANALQNIAPGDKVVVAQMGQGATALVIEAGAEVAASSIPGADFTAYGIVEQNYLKLLAYRERLEWDRGLRGRFIVNEALTTAWRNSEALLGFVGGRCRNTGMVHFPPSRLSEGSGMNLDSQDPWPLADRGGRVATFTADLLAFSPSPPNCYGLVDLHGGGRLLMEFTDPQAAEIAPDTPVEFTFRIKDADAQSGYRRYFWKAVAALQAS